MHVAASATAPAPAGIPEMAFRLKVPVIAYGVLAGGILTAKYLDPERYMKFIDMH